MSGAPAEGTACILLAAGGARRFGGPKLLERVGGVSLARRAAEVAVAAGLRPVIGVVGAWAREVAGEWSGLPVEVVRNPRWEEGLGTSVAVGVRYLLRCHPGIGGAVLLPADVATASPGHLARLVRAARRAGLPAAATGTGGLASAPAYLDRGLLGEAVTLEGDRGARELLRRDPSRVVLVAPRRPLEDVDTREDLDRLRRRDG